MYYKYMLLNRKHCLLPNVRNVVKNLNLLLFSIIDNSLIFAVDFCNLSVDPNTINKICTTAKKRKNHIQTCYKSINIQDVRLILAFFGSKNIPVRRECVDCMKSIQVFSVTNFHKSSIFCLLRFIELRKRKKAFSLF